ncbi:type II toxin-antitoxin system RelE/ParE family toxin [Candidatus Poriferisocius sp.]|uniref:type II toxin-antitoxin system RelE/ParE family toxin n=1 Tax=Candidatus Poriferisocius sp. TaxID=3101276 RepID=UPI003B013BE1
MIVSFRGDGTEDLFNGRNTPHARRACPRQLWGVARRKLDLLDSAATLGDLAVPPGNRLERLGGDRSGQFSIRVNDQFRICFIWTAAGPDQVEVTDYH